MLSLLERARRRSDSRVGGGGGGGGRGVVIRSKIRRYGYGDKIAAAVAVCVRIKWLQRDIGETKSSKKEGV